MEKTAWRSSIVRQFSMKHHTHQHNCIKCNLTACATMCSVQQHFLPPKFWMAFSFSPYFLWEIGINHSVPLNFSVLKCPFLMNFFFFFFHRLWVILALSQLLYSACWILKPLDILFPIGQYQKPRLWSRSVYVPVFEFCLPLISNVHFSFSSYSSSDPFFPFPGVI